MVDPETGSVILAGSSAGCQANRPGIPASIWAGLIGWQAVRASLVTHAAPMGAAKGLLALRSGPVMVADGRAGEVAAISLALGPVPHPATPKIENQDLGRLQWQC